MTQAPFPWKHLLDLMSEGRVIPVVGSGLLSVEQGDGGPTTLEAHCANLLARRLELDTRGASDLRSFNDLAIALGGARSRGPGLQELAIEIKTDLEESIPLPPSLRLLASMPFRLFLTTTFDPMLSRALQEVRFGGRPRARVIGYYPGDRVEDLPERLEQLEGATVFHLFGRLQALPFFALTDEDMLESLLALQSCAERDDKGGLPNLFDALSRSSLLLLGTSFSDWLARFFLRIAAQVRLSSARTRMDFVTDTRLDHDQGLVVFLQQFATGTKIFLDGGPTEFVTQLEKRWRERQAGDPMASGPEPAAVPMERGAVFVSYASEDRAAVSILCAAFEKAGIDFWFDRQELSGGDAWRQKIQRTIQDGSCLVAVLSRSCLTSERREFRHEWSVAEEEQTKATGDLPFILPVALDEVTEGESRLARFKHLHWERAPGGHPTPSLIQKLQQLVRAHRSARSGRP